MSNSQHITEVAWTRGEHEGTPRFKVDGDLVYIYIDNSSRRYTRDGARTLAHGILTALDGARWAVFSTWQTDTEAEDSVLIELAKLLSFRRCDQPDDMAKAILDRYNVTPKA